MADGFFSLGEMIAGGGIDREGARLEGLDLGSKIVARRATTVNALAQARLRVDEQEANLGLADAIEELGLPREMAVHLRAGGSIKDLTGGLLEQQEFGNRANLADLAVSPEQRLQSAQAIEVPKNPFQFGPGGDLFADVFNPGEAPVLSATGPAAIDLDVARAEQSRASAALSDEKRLHPDRFKTSAAAASDIDLAELVLPGGEGTSIIPEDIDVEEAFGVEAFAKGGVNALLDFVGAGTPFEAEAQANTVLRELSASTQIVLSFALIGGRRFPLSLQKLIARYAEDPRQLFRGDSKSKSNLVSTIALLKRSLQRTKDQLNVPSKLKTRTPTRSGNLIQSLLAIADLVADYEKILISINRTQTFKSQFEPRQESDVTQTEAGGSFTVDE